MNPKYSLLILLLPFLTLLSLWFYPSAAPILGMAVLLFSLAVSTHSIIQKHKQAENPRAKIFKDVLILVFTLLLVIFTSTTLSTSLGGLAGLFAAQYAGSLGWGMMAGFTLAILASFAVGYAVRWGVRKLVRQ